MTDANAVLQRAVQRASVTRSVIVERNAIARLPQILAMLGRARACQIVADPNTMNAAGRRTLDVLKAAGFAAEAPIVLDEGPRLKPRVETARDVGATLATTAAMPIAVGAGVINDLTKYAAQLAGIPYVSVATAASMDGYAASGAALLDRGFKRTLACAPPIAIVADLDVIAAAPPRMAAWGYGDMAGKVVAGADWILADAVGEDRIDAIPFALVQDHVKRWLCQPERVAAHDSDALKGLVHGLLISGFAMQARGDSRPASGSEHQMSHLWEMDRVTVDGEPAAHGACVGVGTVTMLALYEWLLAQDVPAAVRQGRCVAEDDPARIDAELRAAFAESALVESARAEMAAKLARSALRESRVRLLASAWPALRARIEATLVPTATMERWLAASHGAFHPGDLGIPLAKLATDYRRARLIRRRYTVLDCIEDLGWLDNAIDALFARDGFWGRRARNAAPAATAHG
jgi:glycerol-1-phosphate dehydrogenase [NAD(P)+]